MDTVDTVTFITEWTHTPNSYRECKARELARLLTIEEGRSTHPHWLEVLKLDNDTRAYFDVDRRRSSFSSEAERKEEEMVVLETAKRRLAEQNMTDIISVCSSHGSEKISYHIVCNYRGKRSSWQALAKLCNLRNAAYDPTPIFDIKVYSKNQKFRLLYCTKPIEGVRNSDPEQRAKILVYGDILDSFISFIPEGTPSWVTDSPPPEASQYKLPPVLRWLSNVLDHPPFREFWRSKADDYTSWVQMGVSIRYEIGEIHASIGYEIFRKFSMLSEKYNEDDTKQKYEVAFRNPRSSNIGKIRAYLMRYRRDESQRFEELYGGTERMDSASIEESDALELVDCPALPDYTPLFSFHYRIIQHMREPAYYGFWKGQLRVIGDLRKVLTLIRFMSDEERYMWGKREEKASNHDQATNGQYWGKKKALEIAFGVHAEQPFSKHLSILSAEQSCLKFVKEAFEITGGDIPYDWFTAEENSDEITKAYLTYRKRLQEIDPDTLSGCDMELEASLLFPLRALQTPNTVERLNWCLAHCKVLKWETQIPYVGFFRYIVDEIPDLSEKSRLILFSHYISRLTAEPMFNFFGNAFTERMAAKTIQSLYPFWFTTSDNVLYSYDDHTGKYTCNEDDHHRIIARFSVLLTVRHMSGVSFTGESHKGKETILKELRTLDQNRPIANFFTNIRLTTTGKLLFPNGIYDGYAQTFMPCVTRNYLDTPLFIWPDMYFFGRVSDPYLETLTTEDEVMMSKIFQDMFVNMHGEEIALIRVEAIALAAFKIPLKKFYVELGPTDAGKSTELALLKNTFGELVGTSNLNKMKYLKDDGKDVSLKLDFVYQNWWKAILLFSEASDCTLDADILKSIASGGTDDATCRIQHKQDVTVPVLFTMFMYLNNPIKVNKQDAAFSGRINYHIWGKRYVPVVTNPLVELQAVPKEEIDALVGSRHYRQLYLHLFIRALSRYVERGKKVLERPADMIQDAPLASTNMQEGAEILEQLMFRFEFTGRKDAYLPASELDEAMHEVTSGTDQQHYKKLLAQAIDSYQLAPGKPRTIAKIQKKVTGKNIQVWVGIARRASLMNEDMVLTDYKQWKAAMELHNGVITDEVLAKLREAAYLCRQVRELTNYERETIETYATQEQIKYLFTNNPHFRG